MASKQQGQQQPKGTVVFLHGSGDSGKNLALMLRYSKFEDELRDLGLELICPTAKPRPYTYAGGMRSTVWFDRTDLHADAPEDAKGADESYEMLRGILDKLQQEKGIGSRSVFVGGFSMGGGMALHVLARHPEPLAGVFGLGSFLATGSAVFGQLGAPAAATPVLLGHGQHDGVVRYEWGLGTARRLHQRLPRVAWYGFPYLDHEVDQRELTVLLSWLRSGGAVFPGVEPLKQQFARLGGVIQEDLGPGPAGAAATGAAATGAAAAAGGGGAELTMTVLEEPPASDGSRSATVVFSGIPPHAVAALLAHPIVARGGHFSLVAAEAGTVKTTFISPQPHEVAKALKDKVQVRLQDPDGGRKGAEGVCPTS